jgi:hypothetical protein
LVKGVKDALDVVSGQVGELRSTASTLLSSLGASGTDFTNFTPVNGTVYYANGSQNFSISSMVTTGAYCEFYLAVLSDNYACKITVNRSANINIPKLKYVISALNGRNNILIKFVSRGSAFRIEGAIDQTIPDGRGNVKLPNQYEPLTTTTEFASGVEIGLSAGYYALKTVKAWVDETANTYQEAVHLNDQSIYKRVGSNTIWESWKPIITSVISTNIAPSSGFTDIENSRTERVNNHVEFSFGINGTIPANTWIVIGIIADTSARPKNIQRSVCYSTNNTSDHRFATSGSMAVNDLGEIFVFFTSAVTRVIGHLSWYN